MRDIWWSLTKNGSEIKSVTNIEHFNNEAEELWKNFQDGLLAASLVSPEIMGGVTLINHAIV